MIPGMDTSPDSDSRLPLVSEWEPNLAASDVHGLASDNSVARCPQVSMPQYSMCEDDYETPYGLTFSKSIIGQIGQRKVFVVYINAGVSVAERHNMWKRAALIEGCGSTILGSNLASALHVPTSGIHDFYIQSRFGTQSAPFATAVEVSDRFGPDSAFLNWTDVVSSFDVFYDKKGLGALWMKYNSRR